MSKPPTDLLFKQSDTWGAGQESFTQLIDPSGKACNKGCHSHADVVLTLLYLSR